MNNNTWPPPPSRADQSKTSAPVVSAEWPVWKRYGLLLGIVANLTVAVSCVHFFFLPYGSGVYYDNWLFFFVLPVSFFAVVFGSGINFWSMGKQRENGGSIALDIVGLALSWLPFPLAIFLLQEAFSLRRLWDNG